MKIIIPFLILLFLFSACLFSQERGFKVVATTSEGEIVNLYKECYALVIGISDYMSGWPDLPNAVGDADKTGDLFSSLGFKVTKVTDPSRAELIQALDSFIFGPGQEEDNCLVIFFAGHGHTERLAYGNDLGYIVPKDAPLPYQDKVGFMQKAIDMQTVEAYARRIQAKHALFLFDSCFSGAIFDMVRAIKENIKYKTARPVRQFIIAGAADESVPDRSIFRSQLTEALQGEADRNEDGYITGTELGEFLQEKVVNYSYGSQHPQYGKIRDPNLDKGDFVFVLEKAELGVQKEIPTPPKAEKLDLSSIEESAKRREEARRKWSNWQEQMRSDSIKVKRIDQNPENTAKEKKNAWEAFLRNYKTDNPYSNIDEQLRQRATQRLKALSEERPRAEMDTDAFLNRGLAYHNKGLYDKAISDYTRAIEINPKYAHAYYNRGLSYYNKGLYDKAISDYTRAIEINPKYVLAFFYKALSCEKVGRINEALEAYKAFIQSRPPNKYASSIEWVKKRIIELEK